MPQIFLSSLAFLRSPFCAMRGAGALEGPGLAEGPPLTLGAGDTLGTGRFSALDSMLLKLTAKPNRMRKNATMSLLNNGWRK